MASHLRVYWCPRCPEHLLAQGAPQFACSKASSALCESSLRSLSRLLERLLDPSSSMCHKSFARLYLRDLLIFSYLFFWGDYNGLREIFGCNWNLRVWIRNAVLPSPSPKNFHPLDLTPFFPRPQVWFCYILFNEESWSWSSPNKATKMKPQRKGWCKK